VDPSQDVYGRTTESAKYQNRIELLQGTLDMLTLQALQPEPTHGYAIAQIRIRSGEVSLWRLGPYTPRCIVWKDGNGSSRNGSSPKASNAQSITN
jgi:hypothetical protein